MFKCASESPFLSIASSSSLFFKAIASYSAFAFAACINFKFFLMLVSNYNSIAFATSDLADSWNESQPTLSCTCPAGCSFLGNVIVPFYPLRPLELGNTTPSFSILLSNLAPTSSLSGCSVLCLLNYYMLTWIINSLTLTYLSILCCLTISFN